MTYKVYRIVTDPDRPAMVLDEASGTIREFEDHGMAQWIANALNHLAENPEAPVVRQVMKHPIYDPMLGSLNPARWDVLVAVEWVPDLFQWERVITTADEALADLYCNAMETYPNGKPSF